MGKINDENKLQILSAYERCIDTGKGMRHTASDSGTAPHQQSFIPIRLQGTSQRGAVGQHQVGPFPVVSLSKFPSLSFYMYKEE